MKKLYLLPIIVFIGCGTLATVNRAPRKVVVAKSKPAVFAFTAEQKVGDTLGTLPNMRGDTLTAVASRSLDWMVGPGYILNVDGQEVFVHSIDVISTYDYGVSNQETSFELPKEKDGIAWGRATSYINKNAGMKIQTANDFIIQTYNSSPKSTLLAFTVTKEPNGATSKYSVECQCANPYMDTRTPAKKMAYYMVTGEEY